MAAHPYAIVPAGSDRNEPRMSDVALAELVARSHTVPLNRPYVRSRITRSAPVVPGDGRAARITPAVHNLPDSHRRGGTR